MAVQTFAQAAAELNALFCAVFTGTWSTIAQNAGSPATSLYISLHNANPGAAGSQTTNETAYTNYLRVAVARTTGGWTVTAGSGTTFSNAVNVAAVTFAQCGATGDTLTHWGVGLASSGAGTLIDYGALGSGPAVPFTSTAAAPGVLTAYGYSATVNDRVAVFQAPGSEGLPTGLTEGTVYFVGTVSGSNITLSTTTANGSPVTTSTTGAGYIYKCSPLAVSNGITPSIAAGAMSIQKG